MSKTKQGKTGKRNRYTDQQKAEALAVIERGDLTIEQIAATYGVNERTVRRWRVALHRSEEATPLTAEERRRYREMERELKETKLQLELLKKFEAFSQKHRR
jgi:transposase-like protein